MTIALAASQLVWLNASLLEVVLFLWASNDFSCFFSVCVCVCVLFAVCEHLTINPFISSSEV